MAWDTPVITHTRGRLVRHTVVTANGTLNNQTPVQVNLSASDMPLAVFGGSVQARSTGATSTRKTTLAIRCGDPSMDDGGTNFLVYRNQFTHTGTVGWWVLQPLFQFVPTLANPTSSGVPTVDISSQLGAFTLPTNEWQLQVVSDDADETSEVVAVRVTLLSHVLEV